MKKLIPFLLFPFSVNAAEIDMGSFELCGATSTYFQDGGCPCDLSITAGPNVDNVSADADVVLAGDNCAGTLHTGLYPAASSPSRADLIAGTGATDKETASPSGAGTVSFTGASQLDGTAEAAYRIHASLVQTNYSNRPTFDDVVTASFNLLANPGGGGTDLTGAGYFICANGAGGNTTETDGSDSNSGLSMASPWLTLAKATDLPAGSDVYFCEGGTWSGERLVVNWTGSASDRVIIGCYFNDGGTATKCENF